VAWIPHPDHHVNPPLLRLSRTLSLQAAASVVFALVALLPILLLLYVLSWADLLRYGAAQLGVFLALAVSVGGFLLFRRLVSQIGRLAETVQATAAGQPVAVPDESGSVVVPKLAEVTEIAQLTAAFRQMVEDLRGATQRLEDLVFKLGTLNETVELAARVPRLPDLLRLVLQHTMRAVRATRGSIMMLDPERQVLRVVVAHDIPDAIATQVEVKLGEGIAGKVAAEGEPILVEDTEADPRFGRQSTPQYGSGAFICMPIRVTNRIIGVINLTKKKEAGTRSSAPFGPIDLQFLNALLTYIGYSVENARLLEEAQQSAQRLHGVVEDLKTTQAQLVRSETLRAIGQLASGMAHHLNNLFALLVGRAELALQAGPKADMPRTLDIILRTARDGAEVVRRVQRFGRARPIAHSGAVDLNDLVRDVVELVRPQWQDEAQRRGCPIEIKTELGGIPPAVGEAGPLREVLMNLLLNAIEALREGGVITLRSWTAEGRALCSVTDTGVGMAEETRRRALEPFFTTKGPKSTGLGLSVAYGTIRRYGGTLEIDSAEGQGTTVTIGLPAAVEEPSPQAGVEGAPSAPKKLRILVIDDQPEVQATLAEMLAEEGHRVLQAGGGREALDLLQSGQEVDLVLTDLGMPEMRGSDVARVIQERWPGLPVGLVTGWAEDEVTEEERLHTRFVMQKPFDQALLREVLARVGSPS
jgi:signal transduction histidine kinase/CheY-like chemotaxis protein/HAMP domain-containing protein